MQANNPKFLDCQVGVVSFARVRSTASPTPHYVIDVEEFRDPMGSRTLRDLYKDGRAGEVQDYVSEDPRFKSIIASAELIVSLAKQTTPPQWISIGVRDYHGRWTAPAVASLIAEHINRKLGFTVSVQHLELNDLYCVSGHNRSPNVPKSD